MYLHLLHLPQQFWSMKQKYKFYFALFCFFLYIKYAIPKSIKVRDGLSETFLGQSYVSRSTPSVLSMVGKGWFGYSGSVLMGNR